MSAQDDTLFVPVGEFLPDLPNFNNPGTEIATNVIPRSAKSYSPMPQFNTAASIALNGAPLGAFSARDAAGNAADYAGTTTKLYQGSAASDPNMADQSGSQVFATAAGGFWSFAEMNGSVYATNNNDPLQSMATAGAGPFAVVNANAPKGLVLATIQPGFLVVGNINDVTVGVKTQGLRWSALGDGTNWPLVGTTAALAVQSDWQNVPGGHGSLKAIAPNLSTCNAAIFFEQAIFRMIYTGTNKIFDFQPVEKQRGTIASRSVVQFGQIVYYMSHDGPYAFDGAESFPIGVDKVAKTFLADLDPNYASQIVGTVDPRSGIVFWAYAGNGNNLGIPNRILVYNTLLRRFSLILGFTGYTPFIARSFGVTLDQIDGLGYTLDTLPYSLDSAILTGGNIIMAGFDPTFKLGYFSGTNMPFTVETTEAQIMKGAKARVRELRPIVEGDAVSCALGIRNRLRDPVTYGSSVAQTVGDACPVRGEGRFMRAQISGAAGSLVTHVQGVDAVYSPAGRR